MLAAVPVRVSVFPPVEFVVADTCMLLSDPV